MKNKCCVDGCQNEAKQKYGGDNKYYCGKHLHHMYRYGKILERTRLSPNDFIIDDIDSSIAYIVVYDNKNNIKNKVMIDTEDLGKISTYKWHINDSTGYCRTSNKEVNNSLHRFLLNLDDFDGDYVDHVNGDKLDNRKCNLRIVTNQQNHFNLTNNGLGNNNRKGVSFRKDRNKWRAYITINGKQIPLGLFETEEEAIKVRIEAEKKYFKEYRRKE